LNGAIRIETGVAAAEGKAGRLTYW
jgi:hypothetical protein